MEQMSDRTYNFSEALKALTEGYAARRQSWPGGELITSSHYGDIYFVYQAVSTRRPTKRYFHIEDFSASDWTIFDDKGCKVNWEPED